LLILCEVNNQNGEGHTYHGNNLVGTLPPEIGYLTNLTDFTILKNPYLIGSIPSSFSNLTNLRRLRLIYNGLQGPWRDGLLKYMTKLLDLDLSYNHFNMTLPLDIVDSASLSTLSMAGNNIFGEIPSTYSNFIRLGKFYLYYHN
jgi:Leucine-rich repeat (LRR) protein